MPRDYRLYLDDILEAVALIREYVKGVDDEAFKKDRKTQDAVIRNLEIIGEAARNVPEDLKENAPAVDWKKIVGLRNILSHAYFGVSIPIIWDVVQNKLDPLEKECRDLLEHSDN